MLRFEPGATECRTGVKITASSDVAFDKKFVLVLRRNGLPPSSGRLNLLSVFSGMTGRRECVRYVAVLGTLDWDNSVGVATRYELEDSRIESLRGEIFRTRPHRPCGPSSFVHSGHPFFPRSKVVGARRWPPTPLTRVLKNVELWIYFPLGPSRAVLGWN